jgi:hypothetical protein
VCNETRGSSAWHRQKSRNTTTSHNREQGKNNKVEAGGGGRMEWVPMMITSVATAAPAVAMAAAAALAIALAVMMVCEDIDYSIILSINLVTKT